MCAPRWSTAKGAFPNTVNRPLMNDIERQKIGTSYKQHGQQAAICGHELVCGALKAERLAAWKAFAEANPNGYLYCFRGGLRSQIVQRWLKQDAGIDYPRVIGGYKALRNFLSKPPARRSTSAISCWSAALLVAARPR